MRNLITCCALLLFASIASAQSPQLIQINSTSNGIGCIVDAGGNVGNGILTVQATDGAGHAMPFKSTVGGAAYQVVGNAVSRTISQGVISPLSLQWVAGTNNAKIPYTFTVTVNGHTTVYQNVDISPNSGGAFDWCQANLAGNIVNGPVTIKGDPGTVTASGVNGDFNVPGTMTAVHGSMTDATIGTLTGKLTNGIMNATQYVGGDIGAKVNAAFASSATGANVFIPAGNYSFSTTINFPTTHGYQLQCDPGATLTYTGSGDAIYMATAGQANMGVEGNGGCTLQSQTPGQGNGIVFHGTNHTFVHGMRIRNFNRGIYSEGGNGIQILNNMLQANTRGLDEITIAGFAPNAIHVAFNEFIGNGWGVYSENGGFAASHALGNTYTHNVFEQNTNGDLWLAWDAQTEVDHNYLESSGVGVSVGNGLDNVYNVRIHNNYFTVSAALRSEIELGYALETEIADNFEEGAVGASSGCRINVTSGPNGGVQGTVIMNAFNVHMEGANGPPTTNDLCTHGAPTNNLGGTYTFQGALQVNQNLSVLGNAVFMLGFSANGATYNATATAVTTGGACTPEAAVLVNKNTPAHMYFCSGGFWRQIY